MLWIRPAIGEVRITPSGPERKSSPKQRFYSQAFLTFSTYAGNTEVLIYEIREGNEHHFPRALLACLRKKESPGIHNTCI